MTNRMKTLVLIRHAEPESWHLRCNDVARKLVKRWEEYCGKIWKILQQKWIHPDVIITSHAVRAKQTSKIIAKILKPKRWIQTFEKIYDGYKSEILDILKQQTSSVETLVLVWHNDAITEIANDISVEEIPELPFWGTCIIQLDIASWEELSSTTSKQVETILPK